MHFPKVFRLPRRKYICGRKSNDKIYVRKYPTSPGQVSLPPSSHLADLPLKALIPPVVSLRRAG